MKIKSLLVALCLITASATYAQKSMLNKGKASYSKFNELKSVNTAQMGIADLQTAIESLEKASEHDKTKDLSETWTFLALSYADYSLLDSTKTDDYVAKAVSALEKAKTTEGAEEQAENIDVASRILAQGANDKGVKAFQSQDYKAAYSNFSKALEYLPGDTLLTFYAGLAAFNAQDYDNAIEKYQSLLKHNDFSSLEEIYFDLSRLYMIQGDTVSAIKTAEEGIAKFPGSAKLKIHSIELKLQTGQEKETIADIEKQIQATPNDKSLYYYLGIAQSAAENDAAAEAAYKNAIELDPNFGEAYINLGGLLLNKGIDIFRDASNLPTSKQKEYTEAMKKGNAAIDVALPYLQKATEINPKSSIAWQNLRTYYQLKENDDKLKEIDAKMENL